MCIVVLRCSSQERLRKTGIAVLQYVLHDCFFPLLSRVKLGQKVHTCQVACVPLRRPLLPTREALFSRGLRCNVICAGSGEEGEGADDLI